MTPSEFFNKPIIGNIKLYDMNVEYHSHGGGKTTNQWKNQKYDIIDETESYFVCNVWISEHDNQPFIIVKNMVEEIEYVNR